MLTCKSSHKRQRSEMKINQRRKKKNRNAYIHLVFLMTKNLTWTPVLKMIKTIITIKRKVRSKVKSSS